MIKTGLKILLSNTNCYQSETTSVVSGKKTGTYYLWDNVVRSGRIRITNKPERVGKSGQVTCWVNIKDIGLSTKTKDYSAIGEKLVACLDKIERLPEYKELEKLL